MDRAENRAGREGQDRKAEKARQTHGRAAHLDDLDDGLRTPGPAHLLPRRPDRARDDYPLIPQPPSFSDYPTAAVTHKIIVDAELVKDMALDVDDVQQRQMRQLVFPGPARGDAGRAALSTREGVRRTTEKMPNIDQISVLDDAGDGLAPGNALAEVPCGACPVESECRVGGIVSRRRVCTWTSG